MAMEEDEELLQDFLVEAGEILEQLGEQLVELENRPQDTELLNAVFRGFHTIKGGASFLNLDPLVNVCHRAEDVFNVLRNGERMVDSSIMDVILPVLDVVNEQFDSLRSGSELKHADAELLRRLEALSNPAGEALRQDDEVSATERKVSESVTEAPAFIEEPVAVDDELSQGHKADEITEEEFEQLLDSLANGGKNTSNNGSYTGVSASAGDEITEEEFDALLDEMDKMRKSKPRTPTVSASADKSTGNKGLANTSTEGYSNPGVEPAKDEYITEEEFDAILDQLHGNSKPGPVQAGELVSSTVAAIPIKSDINAGSAVKAQDVSLAGKSKESGSQTETTVRVDTKRLDDIMNLVGELVLVRNRFATLELVKSDEEMTKVVANLDVVTADLQASVMKTRMQPIKKVFGRFPRVVRDLARNLQKEVNLELQGEDTDLDKNLVEALADPLVHLVRNAVDHGIETPEERVAAGKPRAGTVILTAEQEGDHILLTIEDDGKGMDADQLRRAAVEKGILDEESAARLEPKECYNLIFAPGFSTKKQISDISGRGVGMDVVKTRIVQLNGSVEIDSQKGKGSVIIIKVPLTLAIMPTLMVMLDKQIFALPLASVNEIFHLDLTRTNIVDGQLVVMVRDRALPLFYLRHWLIKNGYGQPLPKEGHVVVVSMGVQRIGFVVDTLIGQEEVVIKPLGALLHGMKGLAGATITGDGRISLILDIPGLMQRYARRI